MLFLDFMFLRVERGIEVVVTGKALQTIDKSKEKIPLTSAYHFPAEKAMKFHVLC